MLELRVVLICPKFGGNVGAVARSMANFGVSDLVLVNPCEIGDEAHRRSKHGSKILDSARMVSSLDEALEGCYLIVGSSGIISGNDKNYARHPLSARELAARLKGCEGGVALLFGREDMGLLQEELNRCDILVTIPSDEEYPILNLSHAATIILYEIFQNRQRLRRPSRAKENEVGLIYDFFDDLLEAIDYPEHRREKSSIMFRRMMGRAVPSRWEFHTIMGILGDAAKLSRQAKRNH